MPRKKSLISFFKRAENWVNIVALLTTVALGYRSLTTGDIGSYLQAVLAVLGMLALGQLAVGYSSILRDRDIEELTEAVESLSQDRLSADSYFRTRKDLLPLDTVLGDATSTVDVLGAGLFALAITHPGIVRTRAGSGVRFRLIMSNPENEFVQDMIAGRLFEIETADRHARLAKTAIENLKAGADQVGADKLQVRVIDQVP